MFLEPIELWQKFSFQGEEWSPLNEFYNDPKKEIFNFQLFVLTTYCQAFYKAYTQAQKEEVKFLFTERTAVSSLEVFSKLFLKTNQLSSRQYALLYNTFLSHETANPKLTEYDSILYLKADPQLMLERSKIRMRAEESALSESYLSDLNEVYTDWATTGSFLPNKIQGQIYIFDAAKSINALTNDTINAICCL